MADPSLKIAKPLHWASDLLFEDSKALTPGNGISCQNKDDKLCLTNKETTGTLHEQLQA